jgi:hypothetical protein
VALSREAVNPVSAANVDFRTCPSGQSDKIFEVVRSLTPTRRCSGGVDHSGLADIESISALTLLPRGLWCQSSKPPPMGNHTERDNTRSSPSPFRRAHRCFEARPASLLRHLRRRTAILLRRCRGANVHSRGREPILVEKESPDVERSSHFDNGVPGGRVSFSSPVRGTTSP